MMAQSWATKQWRLKAFANVEIYLANCIDVSLQAALSPRGKRAFRALSRDADADTPCRSALEYRGRR